MSCIIFTHYSVIVNGTSTISGSHQSTVAVIIGSVFGSSLVILMIVIVTIVLAFTWWKLHKKGSSFTYHYHLHYGTYTPLFNMIYIVQWNLY